MTDQQRAAMQAALEALELAKMNGVIGLHRYEVKEIADAIEQLRAALAEPEAEPVAWGMPSSDGSIVDCIAPGEHDLEPGQYTVPLYTAPPRREWQSLTAEEIEAVWKSCDPKRLLPSFAAAIEAAVKEKNNG